jgi:hypothetical protein
MNMLLTLLLTCPDFLGLGEFGLSVYGSCFLSEHLSNHFQGFRRASPEISTKLDCSFVESARPRSCELILYTCSQDMLVLSSTVASRYYNCRTDGSTSTFQAPSAKYPTPLHIYREMWCN